MNRRDSGSMLAWLALVLVLAAALGLVVFAVVVQDDSPGVKPAAPVSTDNSSGDVSRNGGEQAQQPPQDAAAQPAEPGGEGGQVEQGGPSGNDRSVEAKVAPPIDSAQEAFAAVIQTPEARDWYWSVDDPRYEAQDRGGYYLLQLYALLPAEGQLPERKAVFGDFKVDKQSGSVTAAP
jgi:hypothetical protein